MGLLHNYKIAIIGPEASGKTELAWHLATVFNGIATPEYARVYFNEKTLPADHVLSTAEMCEVMAGQQTIEQGDGLLFIDAGTVHGPLYAGMQRKDSGKLSFHLDSVDTSIMAYGTGGAYDAFLLCYPHEKLEWVDDGQRAMPELNDRSVFADACEGFIQAHYPAIPVVKIDAATWPEREEQAREGLKPLIPAQKRGAAMSPR
ncbi:MAG: AAA family ATPase [Rickettsiales bacterium]